MYPAKSFEKQKFLNSTCQPGLRINEKDSLMDSDIEEFITDTIIIAKVKNGGDMNKMSEAIKKKLNENFGGSWTVIVVKWPIGGLARSGIPWNGTYLHQC